MADSASPGLDLTAPSQQDAKDLVVSFLGGQTDAIHALLERSEAPVGLLVAAAYGLGGSVAETLAPSTGAPISTSIVTPTASFASPGRAQVNQVTTTDMRSSPMTANMTVNAVDVDSFRRMLQNNRRQLAEEVSVAVGRSRVTA